MEKIEVDQIMQQIRQEIEDKDYDQADLKFAEMEGIGGEFSKFSPKALAVNLSKVNESFLVVWLETYTGNPISVFIKKVLRKLMKFFVVPIVNYQNTYNSAATQTMNQLAAFTRENADLKKQVEELREEVKAIREAAGISAEEKKA